MIHVEAEPVYFTEDNDAVLVQKETTKSKKVGVDRPTTTLSTTMPDVDEAAVNVDDATL